MAVELAPRKYEARAAHQPESLTLNAHSEEVRADALLLRAKARDLRGARVVALHVDVVPIVRHRAGARERRLHGYDHRGRGGVRCGQRGDGELRDRSRQRPGADVFGREGGDAVVLRCQCAGEHVGVRGRDPVATKE